LQKVFNLFSAKNQSCEIVAATTAGATCLLTINVMRHIRIFYDIHYQI